MKRIFFALGTTALALSGCYIDGVGMKITPDNVTLDYKEHQLQLTTDHPIATIEIWIDDIYIGNSQFAIERNVAVYDGGWISVILPLPRSDGRNLYIQCNENHSSQLRQCEMHVYNHVGFDTVVITQEGCPEPIGTKDAECQEQPSQQSRE